MKDGLNYTELGFNIEPTQPPSVRARLKEAFTPLPEIIACGTCRHFNDSGALGHTNLYEPIRGLCKLWGTHKEARRIGTDGCNWRDFSGLPAYKPRISELIRRLLHLRT